MSTDISCEPAVKGTNAEPYPLITSLPKKSTPYTDIAILGHPNTFVVENEISIGKFQIIGSEGRDGFLQAVCERPVSRPDAMDQSFPK